MPAAPWVIRVAEAVPAPPAAGPTMPSSSAEALRHLATDYGLLGLLLSIALGVIAVLFWLLLAAKKEARAAALDREKEHAQEIKDRDAAHLKERGECEAQLAALQEARLALLREVLTALGNATAAITMSAQSATERTQSSQALSAEVTKLIGAHATSQQQFATMLKELETQGRDNTKALITLAARLGP